MTPEPFFGCVFDELFKFPPFWEDLESVIKSDSRKTKVQESWGASKRRLGMPTAGYREPLPGLKS